MGDISVSGIFRRSIPSLYLSFMGIPVPETSKDAEIITLSRVTTCSPSSNSSFERKVVIVTPKRDFYICIEDSEVVGSVQESGEPASAELVTLNKTIRVSSTS